MANYYAPVTPLYASLTQVKALLNANTDPTTGVVATGVQDDMLQWMIEHASRKIDQLCQPRVFYPYYKTSKYDWPGTSFELPLRDDLLSLTALINGDGATIPPTVTISNSTVTSYFLYPPDILPKYKITLNIASGKVYLFIGTPQQAIQVQGIFGYPGNEVLGLWNVSASATVQDAAGQTSGATTLLVPTGTIQNGTTLYIESELELVQNVVTANPNDTLTVLRAFNGTTAAVHANGTAINRTLVHPVIARACSRLVVWYFRSKDSANFSKLQIGSPLFGMIELPEEIPAEIAGDLMPLMRQVAL